jgi:hypothetical protein
MQLLLNLGAMASVASLKDAIQEAMQIYTITRVLNEGATGGKREVQIVRRTRYYVKFLVVCLDMDVGCTGRRVGRICYATIQRLVRAQRCKQSTP